MKVQISLKAMQPRKKAVRRCVAQVFFPARNRSYAYYNDAFDLHEGDFVYVDGSLKGQLGRVTTVSYTFKIRRSDYKRILAVVDTDIHGQFHMLGAYFVTFDPTTLPSGKAARWFLPPEEEQYLTGRGEETFPLCDFAAMQMSPAITERGKDYHMEGRVRYLCLNDCRGYAIVEGTKPYEVEFIYRGGMIGSLTCTCFCSYHCKHEVAALLCLQELLTSIEGRYADQFRSTAYFAAVNKETLLRLASDKSTGLTIIM